MVVDAETPRDRGDPSAAVEHRGADASDDLVDRDHERFRNAHGSEKPTEGSESFRPRPGHLQKGRWEPRLLPLAGIGLLGLLLGLLGSRAVVDDRRQLEASRGK